MKKKQEELFKISYKGYDNLNYPRKFLKNLFKHMIDETFEAESMEKDETIVFQGDISTKGIHKQDIEERIFRMYGDGRSIDEIEEYLSSLYGDDISNLLTDRMIDKIIELHSNSQYNIYPRSLIDYNFKNTIYKKSKN